MSKIFLVLMISLSTLFTVFSQVYLKIGLKQIGVENIKLPMIGNLMIKMLFNINMFAWFIFAVLAMVLWIWALAYLDLSFAYPFLSLGYILIIAASAFILHEHISSIRWIGVLLISLGMIFIYKT